VDSEYYEREDEKDRSTYVLFAALLALSLLGGFLLAELLAWLHAPPPLPPFAWLFH
jgi:hypothetical protein